MVERIAQNLNIPDSVQGRFYLVREGLLDSSKRGVWSLTERGRDTHLTPEQAREIFLKWVKIFQEQRRQKKAHEPEGEVVAEGTGAANNDYRSHALEILLKLPAAGFERLCQRLLREAGFTQVVVTGSTGDGGIDGYGTLSVNRLVSFKVLFQCKRYTKAVSPSHVRDFRGAMAGVGAAADFGPLTCMLAFTFFAAGRSR